MKKIVFDLETKNMFQDVGAYDPAKLDMSLVCIFDYETGLYHSFFENELNKLWPILEKADILIGYNSNHFDIPLLNKYYPGDLTHFKSVDILEEIKNSIGRRVSLDQVAEGTLGRKKSGHGLQAIEWWKKGDLESLKKYCLEDVKITKDIYDIALSKKSLKFSEGGKTKEIPLNTSSWEDGAVNSVTFSLPF